MAGIKPVDWGLKRRGAGPGERGSEELGARNPLPGCDKRGRVCHIVSRMKQ